MSDSTERHIIEDATTRQKLFVAFEIITLAALFLAPAIREVWSYGFVGGLIALYLLLLVYGSMNTDSTFVGQRVRG